jgi:hypothetical protein
MRRFAALGSMLCCLEGSRELNPRLSEGSVLKDSFLGTVKSGSIVEDAGKGFLYENFWQTGECGRSRCCIPHQ